MASCAARLRPSRGPRHDPHQGGPLGCDSIEDGLLRRPWHGFDPALTEAFDHDGPAMVEVMADPDLV